MLKILNRGGWQRRAIEKVSQCQGSEIDELRRAKGRPLAHQHRLLTFSMKDSESWVLARPEGVGAKALATAKKAKRVAITLIVDWYC